MKFQKLIVIAASLCLLAVFVTGPAYAQDRIEAMEIWDEFCEEIVNDAEKAFRDLADANDDLDKCFPDFVDCRTGEGFGRADSLVDCLADGNTCTSRANEDEAKACSEFAEDLEDAWKDALRRADIKDVEGALERYLNDPNPTLGVCFRPARQVFRVCAGRPIARP